MTNLSAEYFHQFLLKIYPCAVPFTLKVVHKKYKRRLGTYFIGDKRINIYDGRCDNIECMEVAIHEYAHHLHRTEPGLDTKLKTKADRSHGSNFFRIYSFLMLQAYQKGLFIDEYMLPLFNKIKY